ncbi:MULTISPECIES: CBS domain-containing protein [Thalassobacillus]|uniref:CBS domain-containing protein n=1 Tax=Thalassobacillus TaxID=331971 RepID=UPI000A1CCBCE|nr:CBS domain-containing protein [Thalassobacillus devorans]
MFVKSIMKPPHECKCAQKHDSLKSVIALLEKHDIQAVPVLDETTFVGMLSKETIYKGFFESDQTRDSYLEKTLAGDLVEMRNLYIKEDEVFERTLPVFAGFPVIAVVDSSKKFLGLVTRADVLEQFESAFGVKRKGIRIAFTSEESAGRIERLGDILKQYHENVISLATFDETDKLARRIVLKVDPNDNIDKFTEKLEKTGFRVLDIKEV